MTAFLPLLLLVPVGLVLFLSVYLVVLNYRGGREVVLQVRRDYGIDVPLMTAMSILDPRAHVVERLGAGRTIEYDRATDRAVVSLSIADGVQRR